MPAAEEGVELWAVGRPRAELVGESGTGERGRPPLGNDGRHLLTCNFDD